MQSGNSVETSVTLLETYEPIFLSGTISAAQLYLDDNRITSDMRVTWCAIGRQSNITSDLDYTTTDGRITFSGTVEASTTISLVLERTN